MEKRADTWIGPYENRSVGVRPLPDAQWRAPKPEYQNLPVGTPFWASAVDSLPVSCQLACPSLLGGLRLGGFGRFRQIEALLIGVVLKEFGIAAPIHRRFELFERFGFGVAL